MYINYRNRAFMLVNFLFFDFSITKFYNFLTIFIYSFKIFYNFFYFIIFHFFEIRICSKFTASKIVPDISFNALFFYFFIVLLLLILLIVQLWSARSIFKIAVSLRFKDIITKSWMASIAYICGWNLKPLVTNITLFWFACLININSFRNLDSLIIWHLHFFLAVKNRMSLLLFSYNYEK